MQVKWTNCSRRSRAAMTLVEVLAGLALLASLLVGLLVARAGYLRQSAIADRRLRAVAAADALLTRWHLDPMTLVRSGSGTTDNDAFAWRTSPVNNAAVDAMKANVVRLEVLDARGIGPVLASVDF